MPYSRLHGGGGCLKVEHVLFGEPAIRMFLCEHRTQEQNNSGTIRGGSSEVKRAQKKTLF